ncbi:MAG: hypothetical protein IJ583_12695, partial [Firmicutes bacterium]|nr:hypothetical protein [Bacillota bacterium]
MSQSNNIDKGRTSRNRRNDSIEVFSPDQSSSDRPVRKKRPSSSQERSPSSERKRKTQSSSSKKGSKGKKKKKQKKISKIGMFFRIVFVFFIFTIALVFAIGSAAVLGIIENAPQLGVITVKPNIYTSIIYDMNGNEIDRLHGDENREYVTLDNIPQNMQ